MKGDVSERLTKRIEEMGENKFYKRKCYIDEQSQVNEVVGSFQCIHDKKIEYYGLSSETRIPRLSKFEQPLFLVRAMITTQNIYD